MPVIPFLLESQQIGETKEVKWRYYDGVECGNVEERAKPCPARQGVVNVTVTDNANSVLAAV
jgi:hypothetical protein